MGEHMAQNGHTDDLALREAMIARLKNLGLLRTAQIEEALRAVPRHIFVPGADLELAYGDAPIVTRTLDGVPISSASAPTVMAVMLEMLDLQPGQRVLEIGAGTGYNAALMAHIVGNTGQVVTLDLDEDIVQDARDHLMVAGIENVEVMARDGTLGWPDTAPYDRVILTVGAADIAAVWREQLRPDGRLVLPFQAIPFQSELAMLLTFFPDQLLVAFERNGAWLESSAIRPCIFMPLRGIFAMPSINPVNLSPEPGISCTFMEEADPHAAFAALNMPPQDEATSVWAGVRELGGLRLWLALHEPHFCELHAHGAATGESMIPSVVGMQDQKVTFGLYDQDTWSLLMLVEDPMQTTDLAHPLNIVVRRFGPAESLARHLQEAVAAWERAGRPFNWSPQGTMEQMRIRACPLETVYTPEAHELLLTRRWTRFIFTSQASAPALQATPPEAAARQPEGQATLDREQQISLLKQGKEAWNQWRKRYPEIEPDLVDAELDGTLLRELDLRRAHLNGSSLARVDLFGSDLSGANLSGANLNEARAANVNLGGADLSGADLREAFIVKTNLNGARLNGVNLGKAHLKGASLNRADLSGGNLSRAHLNRVILDEADLSGATFDEITLQDSYFPDPGAWGEVFSAYRQHSQAFYAFASPEQQAETTQRSFDVGPRPRVVLRDVRGTIHVHTWSERSIKVEATGEPPQMRQDEDTVFITGGEGDLDLLVPRIPYGIVRLVKHGSATITTAVMGDNLSGDVLIEDAGAVSLSRVAGAVGLSALTGDVELDHLRQGASLAQITGNVHLRDVQWVTLDVVRGSLFARQIAQALHCGYVGGNCVIQQSQEAVISVARVGGNAELNGIAQALDCTIGGNAWLQLVFPVGSFSRIKASGTLSVQLPEHPNLQISVAVAGQIRGGALAEPQTGGFANLTYGPGRARLDVTAGGGLKLDVVTPSHATII